MRVYVFERGDDRCPAYITSEHRLNLSSPEEELDGIAERMGTFPEWVRSREQLLETREGRRALREWDVEDDARFDRMRDDAAVRRMAADEEMTAWRQALTPAQRRDYERRSRAHIRDVLGLTDEQIDVIVAEDQHGLRLV